MKPFKMIHHVDRETIAAMYDEYAPVFVLSTGRAGSKFITRLLGLSPAIQAFHEPRPTLQYFSNFASRNQERADVLQKMIDAARMEMILETYISGKVFVESNQCLTFFAPALAGLFKNSRFAHLVRHPGDFVASAVRKGWHKNDSIWEAGRAMMADGTRWAGMDQVERLGWLWDFTNRYIRGFLAALPAARGTTCLLKDLLAGPRSVAELFSFCGAAVPEAERVAEVQGRPVNTLWIDADEPDTMKKNPGFPAYGDWPAEMKDRLWETVGEAAKDYGYEK